MMLDATKQDIQRELLEKELESVGIRLNKRKPNIYFKVRTCFCDVCRHTLDSRLIKYIFSLNLRTYFSVTAKVF